MNGRTRGLSALAALALLNPRGIAPGLAAQGVLSQFSYDNLRPTGIQLDLGLLGASRLTGAVVGGVRMDYGRIAPRVRVLLGLSYFRSQFDQEARNRFEQRIRALVDDPTNDATIDVGRIHWSDITAEVDLQYVLPQGKGVTTYMGLGFGVHLRNASGTAIDGTFVEDALDAIAAAANLTLGAEIAFAPAWHLTVDTRGVVSSGLSTVSLRSGIMWRFADRRPAPASRP